MLISSDVFMTIIGGPFASRLRDALKPVQNVLLLSLASFFKEVLHKSLLPLYLLLVAGTMSTVGLGVLSPLLYTDHWGHSLHQMGANIAIGSRKPIPVNPEKPRVYLG